MAGVVVYPLGPRLSAPYKNIETTPSQWFLRTLCGVNRRTHDLTKQYGTVLAVDDLSLSIPEGVVYGVLSRTNGAGKTTMMRMLTTLTKPTSGSARGDGRSITDRLALVEHIGYLPEEPPLFDELSDTSSWTISAACVISRWSQRKERIEKPRRRT